MREVGREECMVGGVHGGRGVHTYHILYVCTHMVV